MINLNHEVPLTSPRNVTLLRHSANQCRCQQRRAWHQPRSRQKATTCSSSSSSHTLRAPTSTARRSNDALHSVAVRDLKLSLGQNDSRRQILTGVDLKVQRGSLHMLLGPNGCGKSTLLRVLGGLVTSYSGLIDTDGPSGFVFQNPDHQVVMPTVAADVAFGLGRYKMTEGDVAAAVSAALRLVNMQDYMYRPTHTLSGGQRQRVAIAGALAEDPKLLLLDELTTFLDVEDQFGVLTAVRNITHLKSDVTAIWVTHRFEELEYADAASYMEAGRVVFTGTPQQTKEYLRSLGAPI